VTEVFWAQLRDVTTAWQFIEDGHKENTNLDVHSVLYAATRLAVQAVSAELVRQEGDGIAGRR
jgi:hypothetical protein